MTNSIEKTIDLKAPIERVWRSLTDAAEFGEWFRVKMESAFKPGQAVRGRILHPGFEHLQWEVTVVSMDEPHLFSFTWHPFAIDPNVDYSDETPTLVEFRLQTIPGGTRLDVTESGFDAIPEHRRAEALRMNDGGWAQQILNIQRHVKS